MRFGCAILALLLAGCTGQTPSDAPSSAATVAMPAWKAIGTEPFWGFTLADTALVYSTPENQAGERIAVRRTPVSGGEDVAGELGGMPFLAEIRSGACSDGMSDEQFSWQVSLTVRGEQRRGCARSPQAN